MPSWGEVLKEIEETKVHNPLDIVRRKYLKIMSQYTGRNVIAYYSAFLQKPGTRNYIDDNDKNAFMQTICGLDKSKGLDLILHTPGGEIAAAESIVEYLKSIFNDDIRVFIPQIAMSAGTMISLSSKEIVMGKQSNIGPIDPQFGGISCAGILEEYEQAKNEIACNPSSVPLWQSIFAKYHPTFIGDCKKSVDWADTMVRKWLSSNMFKDDENAISKIDKIVMTLSSHEKTFSHSKHIGIDACVDLGLKIVKLENIDKRKIKGCNDLQDCVLTIHHSYMHSFSNTNALKIIENHLGNAMIINGGGK